MTYNVFCGTLSLTQSINQFDSFWVHIRSLHICVSVFCLSLYMCVCTVTQVGQSAYWQSRLGLGRELRDWVWDAAESKECWSRSPGWCLLRHKRHSKTVEPSGGQLLRSAHTLWLALFLSGLQVRTVCSSYVLFKHWLWFSGVQWCSDYPRYGTVYMRLRVFFFFSFLSLYFEYDLRNK